MKCCSSIASLACLWLALTTTPTVASTRFVRGDATGDGVVLIDDAITTLGYVFGGESVSCLDAVDANDDGNTDIADAIFALTYLFGGGNPPSTPFPSCGIDPTLDSLDCVGPVVGCCDAWTVRFASVETGGIFESERYDGSGADIQDNGFRFLAGSGRFIAVQMACDSGAPTDFTQMRCELVPVGGYVGGPFSQLLGTDGVAEFEWGSDLPTAPLPNPLIAADGLDSIRFSVELRDDATGRLLWSGVIAQDLKDRMRQEYLATELSPPAGVVLPPARSAIGVPAAVPWFAICELSGWQFPATCGTCGSGPSPNYYHPVSNLGIVWNNGFPSLASEVRDNAGFPVRLSSGHRSPSHNSGTPGSSQTSNHLWGRATDLVPCSVTPQSMLDLYRAALLAVEPTGPSSVREVILESRGQDLWPRNFDPPFDGDVLTFSGGAGTFTVEFIDATGSDFPESVTPTFGSATPPLGVPFSVGLGITISIRFGLSGSDLYWEINDFDGGQSNWLRPHRALGEGPAPLSPSHIHAARP